MNKEETRALWESGAEAWNSWALQLLERKQALETAGDWSADWFGEGQNDKTRAWLAEARADFEGTEFAADADFSGFVFPGHASFIRAHFIGIANFSEANFASMAYFTGTRFDGEAKFAKAKFHGLGNFDESAFASPADFDQVEFLRETTGPLVPAARFQKAEFLTRADFRNAAFTGIAEFQRCHFVGNVRFDESEFKADAVFEGVEFEGTPGFVKTRFSGGAKFSNARFRKDCRFGEAEFTASAHFDEAEFTDHATFRFIKFGGDTTFQKAKFHQEARFRETRFAETAIFRSADFSGPTDFTECAFAKSTDFHQSRFREDTCFERSEFSDAVEFTSARFKSQLSFTDARFEGPVKFLLAGFKGRTSFRNAQFLSQADFSGVQSRAAFVLSGARFVKVPDFHDANFADPPSLDSMKILDPVSYRPARAGGGGSDPRPILFRLIRACGDNDYAARYRRLGKLAAATQDFEREREFFAQELRCRRFWHDRPLGTGMSRFWFGLLYGAMSNFGRSVIRPLLFWALTVLGFSLIYLGLRRADDFASAGAPAWQNGTSLLLPQWPSGGSVVDMLEWGASALGWFMLSIVNLFAGGGCISGKTGATGEALFLSFKNSLFFLGWESPDASRRVYRCLYGFDSVSGNGEALVRVPLSVSVTATLENMIGLTFIILFVIAAEHAANTVNNGRCKFAVFTSLRNAGRIKLWNFHPDSPNIQRGAAGRVRFNSIPGPMRSLREPTLTGAVVPDTRRPPTL